MNLFISIPVDPNLTRRSQEFARKIYDNQAKHLMREQIEQHGTKIVSFTVNAAYGWSEDGFTDYDSEQVNVIDYSFEVTINEIDSG